MSIPFAGRWAVSQCSSCSLIHPHPHPHPLIASSSFTFRRQFRHCALRFLAVSRLGSNREVGLVCRVSETEDSQTDAGDDEKNNENASIDSTSSIDPNTPSNAEQPQEVEQVSAEVMNSDSNVTGNNEMKINGQGAQDEDAFKVTIGSPLPGVKPRQFDEADRIPKETIDILRDQVFGFDTFFITGQEPYEVKLS